MPQTSRDEAAASEGEIEMSTYANEITVPNSGSARMDGPSVEGYVGQTFEALPGYAQELTIQLGWRPVSMRLLIVDVDDPTDILFESVAFQAPSDQNPVLVDYTFALGGLDLTAGDDYAFILDAYVEKDNNVQIDQAQVGLTNISSTDAYPDGEMVTLNLGPFPSGTREDHLSSWSFTPTTSTNDLSFFLGFSEGADDGFVGTDEDDTIYGGTVGATIKAMGGNDTVYGGDDDDVIRGGKGDDRLFGNGGDDVLRGGTGADFLHGERGNDRLFGNGGADKILGGNGHDLLDGGNGDDTLLGGNGDDTLDGGAGDDTLKGGDGDDTIFSTAGSDFVDGGDGYDILDVRDRQEGKDYHLTFTNIEEIYAPHFAHVTDWSGASTARIFHGGTGSDTVWAGSGDDWIDGGAGNDELSGGAGDDVLMGGSGRDVLYAGDGDDTVEGGGGSDTIYASYGKDTLDGGDGTDKLVIDLTDLDPQSFSMVWNMKTGMLGTSDNPDANRTSNIENLRLFGNFDITVTGDALDNKLVTGQGADVLKGYGGDDVLKGGGGRDKLKGGAGQDTLDGGSGNDFLNGGEDRDRLDGAKGNDQLTGGLGNDIFNFRDGFGHDQIKDFDATADKEKIDLGGVTAIENFADLRNNHMTEDGADVVIDAGGGNTITLLDVDLADLNAADFLF